MTGEAYPIAACYVQPSSVSGTEQVSFGLTFNSTEVACCSLVAGAGIINQQQISTGVIPGSGYGYGGGSYSVYSCGSGYGTWYYNPSACVPNYNNSGCYASSGFYNYYCFNHSVNEGGTTTELTLVSGSTSLSYFDVSVSNTLTLNVFVPNGVPVTVDGSNQTAGAFSVRLPPGGEHSISVPQTVQTSDNTRLIFDSWSDGNTLPTRSDYLTDDTNLTATYTAQYALTLTDPAATGSGWYDQGYTAQISAPSSEPMPGILGLLGGTQTFQGWYENGTLVSSSSNATITMNVPQTLSTQWSTNTTTPLIVLILLIVVIGGGLFAFDTHRRRTIVTTPTPPPTQTVAPLTEEKPRSSGCFCINCGTKLPEDAKFCNKCGTQQT